MKGTPLMHKILLELILMSNFLLGVVIRGPLQGKGQTFLNLSIIRP
jgi:hypothetical protein